MSNDQKKSLWWKEHQQNEARFWQEFRQLRRQLIGMEKKWNVTDLYMEAHILSFTGGGKIVISIEPRFYAKTIPVIAKWFDIYQGERGGGGEGGGLNNKNIYILFVCKQQIFVSFLSQKKSLESQRVVKDPITRKYIVGTNVLFLSLGP